MQLEAKFCRIVALTLLATGWACGGDDELEPPELDAGAGGAAASGTGGASPTGCPPGTVTADDSSCVDAGQGAGVAPEDCGAGFEANAVGGCEPILPSQVCELGLLAVPGDSSCHDLAPCGTTRWGDIPLEGNTQYVDVDFGGASLGTDSAPWKSIQDGIDHAEPNAIVAIAAGTYAENVVIQDRSVRVWGRCPSMVTIAGVGTPMAIVSVSSDVNAELHDLAITGPATGVRLGGTAQVVADRVWIHDNDAEGIVANPGTSVEIAGSLIERTTGLGLFALGATVALADSAVRETQAATDPSMGFALMSQDAPSTGRSSVTMTGVVIERNQQAAMRVFGTELALVRCVVRQTLPRSSDDGFGRGVDVNVSPSSGERSSLQLQASVVEDNLEYGVVIHGSMATIEHSVVRRTGADQATRDDGTGILIQDDPNGAARAEVTIRESLIEENRTAGVQVAGSDVVMEGTIVRNTQPSLLNQRYGRGVLVQRGYHPEEVGRLTLQNSIVAHNREVSVSSFGSELTVDATRIEDTQPQASDDQLGRGLSIQLTPEGSAVALVRDSVIARNYEAGLLAVGAELTVEHTLVEDTVPGLASQFGGVAIAVQNAPQLGARSSGTVRSCSVRNSVRAGIVALGSDLVVQGGEVSATLPDPFTGSFGDGIDFVAQASQPGAGSVSGTQVAGNARAGVAVFGAHIRIDSNDIECNDIDLNGEDNYSFGFVVDDLGGNVCRCGDDVVACMLLSAGLEPPGPLG